MADFEARRHRCLRFQDLEHDVLLIEIFSRCTISREILSGYYKSIKTKPFELPEEDDHAFGE